MQRILMKQKQENTDFLNMIDKCTQIMKDDRLLLRQLVKDNNSELLTILTTYKKKNDYKLLQQELRRFVQKIRGRVFNSFRNSKENTSIKPQGRDQSKQTLRNAQSPPMKQQRSLSRQPPPSKSSEKKYDQSPRFNEDIKKFNQYTQFTIKSLSPEQIEHQKQQLEQFEQKLKLYTSGENFKVQETKRDEIVIASFQNFVIPEDNHRRLYSQYEMTESKVINHSHTNTQPIITEDEIMKKYADLFTAPEFLQQCKATLQRDCDTSESMVLKEQCQPCQSTYFALVPNF